MLTINAHTLFKQSLFSKKRNVRPRLLPSVVSTASILLSIVGFIALPSNAYAGSSLTLDLPSIHIGIHDRNRHHTNNNRYRNHHNRSHKRYRHQQHHHDRYNNRFTNRHHNRYNDRQYNNYYSHDRRYRYNDRRYNDRRYNNRYSGYRYVKPRPRAICPTAGYSPYDYRDQDCYAHGDHFHCTD